jgi:redox-sensitive bicupin YhaK (pirin superfamily)
MVGHQYQDTLIASGFTEGAAFQYFRADAFPTMHPVHWLHSHFAVGGWSPLQRLSGMLTAHMTSIAPHNGFTWHPHRGLEIYTWVLEGTLYHEDTTGGKGTIQAGELQRMFAGDYIEHQELNRSGELARVIQIWFLADAKYKSLEPHYQQLGQQELPTKRVGDATVYSLIGDGSPMEQHVEARLSATNVPAGGKLTMELPTRDEQLFLYITDGRGQVTYGDEPVALGQYDVILARNNAQPTVISAEADSPLSYLSFYLPPFMR